MMVKIQCNPLMPLVPELSPELQEILSFFFFGQLLVRIALYLALP